MAVYFKEMHLKCLNVQNSVQIVQLSNILLCVSYSQALLRWPSQCFWESVFWLSWLSLDTVIWRRKKVVITGDRLLWTALSFLLLKTQSTLYITAPPNLCEWPVFLPVSSNLVYRLQHSMLCSNTNKTWMHTASSQCGFGSIYKKTNLYIKWIFWLMGVLPFFFFFSFLFSFSIYCRYL